MEAKELVEKIKKGELDCNNQQLFFSFLLKGLLLHLNQQIKIRNLQVPHMIIHTGDDTMWLMEKEYDYSKEPYEITNEQYIYQVTPRCTVSPGSIDILTDQVSNPYTRGNFQMEVDSQLWTLNGEFRRMPLKMSVDLKYYLDSFSDMLELMQHIVSKLAFINVYKIVYMGQAIQSSYTIPTSLQDEHMVEMDGTTQDNKDRIVSLTLEIESNLPVFNPETVVVPTPIIHPIQKMTNKGNEIATRNAATRSGHRGFGTR